MADQVGIRDNSIGHALIPFDLENDGDLDLLLASGNERPRVFRNDASPRHSWLSVRLSDDLSGGNRWGDGARGEYAPEHLTVCRRVDLNQRLLRVPETSDVPYRLRHQVRGLGACRRLLARRN
ncbi:MAG: hypothetical protein R2735_12950 [Microthrixaceae bacterium]